MCGICGLIDLKTFKSSVNQSLLRSMVDVLAHRGPDDWGIWISEDKMVGFGHRRLSIVDLSPLGAQPMTNEDQTIWVTFNGEIYNFQELRKRLEASGHRFRSNSDTEVLVHLYEEFGDDMVNHLDGDFGFGLWDDRRKRLLLARDRAGVKPVYYIKTDNEFIFASEIKSILQHPAIYPEIDEESLYHYLTYLVVPPPKTLFQNIYKLPIASVLTLELGNASPTCKIRQYWEPFPNQFDIHPKRLDEQLAEIFQNSVKKRLMSDVPVGVLFSGGVDSILNTVYFQKEIEPQKVKTYNVGFSDTQDYQDESLIARKIAQTIGTEHYEIKISSNDLISSTQELVSYQDEPISDPVSVPLYFVTKLAKETGTTVLHAGEGADEIFCGYDKYRHILHQHNRLWQPLTYMPKSINWLGFQLLSRSHVPIHRKMADSLRRLAHGQEFFMSSAIAYFESEKSPILSSDFKQRFKGFDSFDVVAPLYKRIEKQCPNASLLQKMTFIELQLRLPELLLMRVDKMSMANAVEVRVPFLDRDLVDFALSIPQSFKLRDGVSKEPIKRLVAQHISRETIYKPKRGFGVPVHEWFGGELGDQMRDLLKEDSTELEGYFNLNQLDENLKNKPTTVNQGFQLWVVYNFINWRRSFMANKTGP